MLFNGAFILETRLRAVWVRFRGKALAIGDEQVVAVRRDSDGRRIPADRDKAQRPAAAWRANVKYGYVIVAGIRHEERALVRRERQTIRGRARQWRRKHGSEERVDDMPFFSIDDCHDLAIGIGHVQQTA